MGRNILIVESKNDKHFFQAVIRKLNFDIEVTQPIRILDQDYTEMDGLDHVKLKNAFGNLKANIQKGEIEKVGVIIDIDNCSEEDRISLVNECMQEKLVNSQLLIGVNKFIDLNIDDLHVQLGCYFTNIDGQGGLETVLRTIKNQPSTYADCLQSWKDCLQNSDRTIKDKDFDKFWVDMYIRFDTCSDDEKKQAGRKCSMRAFEYVMENKSDIWDLEHPKLNSLKEFLGLFD